MNKQVKQILQRPGFIAALVMLVQLVGAAQSATGLQMVWFDLIIFGLLAFLTLKNRKYLHLAIGFSSVVICLLADPATGLWFMVWLMLVPMFILIRDIDNYRELFCYGQWIGWLITAGLFSWLWVAMENFFEPSIVFISVMFTLICFVTGFQFSIFFLLAKFISKKIPVWLAGALAYTFVEFWIPLLFPIQLAMAFSWTPPLIQVADIVGMTGIALFIALVNGLLLWLYESWSNRQWQSIVRAGIALVVLLALQTGYGFYSLQQFEPARTDDSLRVAIIQPVSPLKVMNSDHENKLQVAEKLKQLSIEAIEGSTGSTDLLIWPEGAASLSYRSPDFNPEYSEVIQTFLQEYPVPLLIQDVEFVRQSAAQKLHYYSTATLVDGDGEVLGGYRKNILLPFAEYLPGEESFPFLKKFFGQTRSILKGDNKMLLEGAKGKMVPLICYELLFGNYVREFVKKGRGEARYIVNLTNDRWYGTHQQPWQHLSFAIFRAIENRLPMIRSTNSGISAIIDSRGQIIESTQDRIMQETTLRGKIRLPSQASLTFYTLHGDWLMKWVLSPIIVITAVCSISNLFRKPEQEITKTTRSKRRKKH